MVFTEETLIKIKRGQYKIGYVDTLIEISDFGPPPLPAQGMALEILVFSLGAVVGGVTAGFFNALGNDLYQKLKSFFQKDKIGIVELRKKHKKREWKVFCYAFVFKHEDITIAIAYDVRDEQDLEDCITKAEVLIIDEIATGLRQVPNDADVLEIDVHPDYRNPTGQFKVSHRWRCTSEHYLWLNNALDVDPEDL